MKRLAREAGESISADVKKIILASIPERKNELVCIYDKYEPTFAEGGDKKGWSLDAGSNLIRFIYRTLLHVWLLGFASLKAAHDYSGILKYFQVCPQIFRIRMFNKIGERLGFGKEFDHLIDKVNELSQLENIQEFNWRQSIPSPQEGKPKGSEGAGIFDLIAMATAYLFLHEIRHIQYAQEDHRPNDSKDEEMECDKYARSMMLDELPKYSNQSGYDLELLKNKRAMSIALASFLLLVITPKENLTVSCTHPPIASRIKELVSYVCIEQDDIFWNYLSCLLLSQLRYEDKLPQEISFTNTRAFCTQLLDYID